MLPPPYRSAPEPYGQVVPPTDHQTPLQYRKRTDASSPAGPDAYRGLPWDRFGPTPYSVPAASRPLHDPFPLSQRVDSAEAAPVASYPTSMLVACLYNLLLLWRTVGQASMVPLQATLFVGLLLYAADLANVPRSTYLYLTVASMSSLAIVMLLASTASLHGSSILVHTATTLLTLTAITLWLLRYGMDWLNPPSSTISKQLQAALVAILPPLTAAMTALHLAEATWLPLVFAVSLAGTMLWLGGNLPTHDSVTRHPTEQILPSMARGHWWLLLGLPGMLQVVLQFQSRWSSHFWFDLIIVVGLSYLLALGMVMLEDAGVWSSPYGAIARKGSRASTACWGPLVSLRACVIPATITSVLGIALHQRYLLALSQYFARYYLGTTPSIWMTSLYWMMFTVSLLTALIVQTASATFVEWLGEYQEDVVQLGLAMAGAALGKAFGMSWSFTPLPVLAFLGLALWLSTRLLRYLAVFLFVVYATGAVVFSYRFAGMDQMTMKLPIPGNWQISILRFAFAGIWCSSLLGLAAGFAIRSDGGILGKVVKKWDFAGIMLVLYALGMSLLEISLLKRPLPINELAGVDVEADDLEGNDALYDHLSAILSSLVMIALAYISKRYRLVSEYSGWGIISLAIGKAIAVYIDAIVVARDPSKVSSNGTAVFMRMMISAWLCIVLSFPHIAIEPLYLKTLSRRRTMSGGYPTVEIPAKMKRRLLVYAFIVLPATFTFVIPYVLLTLIKVLNEQFRDDYIYSSKSPLPELLGGSLALWGLACLMILNHCLPDGGGEGWKKSSGLTFLFGMGVVFIAPTLGTAVDSVSNPYAGMSSFGSRLVSRGSYRSGGWGLLSCAFATLLAIAGPLELKERTSTGQKDRFLLMRTLIFSIMFGGGVAWFVVLQSMRDANTVSLVIVLSSSLAIAFMGTIAAVFGYFLPINEFIEASQMISQWVVVWAVVLAFCWSAEFFTQNNFTYFGAGGWLSSLLTVSSITSLSIALSVKCRKTKNALTRASNNLMTILSWCFAVAILFGRCGLAGIGAQFEIQQVFGLPSAIIGTFFISNLLLLLEGEPVSERVRGSSRASQSGTGAMSAFSFQKLSRNNWWAPVYFGNALVMLLASAYAIFLRGAWFLNYLGAEQKSPKALLGDLFDLGHEGVKVSLENPAGRSFGALGPLSTRLHNASFWTADNIMYPMMYLLALLAVLPSIGLLFAKTMNGMTVSITHVTLALPLSLIPVACCRGLPSLQIAGVMALLGGLFQAVQQKRANNDSMMRI